MNNILVLFDLNISGSKKKTTDANFLWQRRNNNKNIAHVHVLQIVENSPKFSYYPIFRFWNNHCHFFYGCFEKQTEHPKFPLNWNLHVNRGKERNGIPSVSRRPLHLCKMFRLERNCSSLCIIWSWILGFSSCKCLRKAAAF